MRILKSLYLTNRFFMTAAVLAVLFVFAYLYPWFFLLAQIVLLLAASVLLYDFFLLYSKVTDIYNKVF